MSTDLHTVTHVTGLKFSFKAECTCGWKSHVFFWDDATEKLAQAKQRKFINDHKAKYNV